MSLLGRLAFVTGAGSGIGRAACKIFANEGATIIAADKNLQNAKETIDSLSTKSHHLSLEIDVAKSTSVKTALEKVLEVFKRPPSIIVNSAGIVRDNFINNMTEKEFDQVLNVNLKGTFLVIQEFSKSIVEHQIKNASIVNIGSIVSTFGNIGQANYCASKAGVEGLTKTAARELGNKGVRVNVVLPGFIETAMTESVPEKVKGMFISQIALKRMGKPEEVAEVIAFLASDKSSYVTGASIQVTGLL